jgi:hypothetical protein
MSSSVQEEDGLFRAEADEPLREGRQRLLHLLLRRRVEDGITIADRDRQERGEQRHCLDDVPVRLSEQGLQLIEPLLGGVVGHEACRELELADDRVEGAVGVARRALVAQVEVRLAFEPPMQHVRDAGLADARFAGEQNHLPLAALGPLPAVEQ